MQENQAQKSDQCQIVDQKVEVKQKMIEKPKRRRRARKKVLKTQDLVKPQITDINFQWDENDDFVVQRIIDEEVCNGKKYYLIKWKNFDIALSTWEDAQNFKGMTDLIELFKKSQKQKRDTNIREAANVLMNPYRATQIHGHFLYGDQPHQIVNKIVQFNSAGKKTIYLQVSWKHRQTNEGEMYLQNSILESDVIFEHNPQFLLNYYQKSLQLKPLNQQ